MTTQQWYYLLSPRKISVVYLSLSLSEQSVLLLLPYFPRPSQVSLSSTSVLLCCSRETTYWLPLHMFHFWQRVLVLCIIPCSPRCCRMFPFLTLSPICAAQYVVSLCFRQSPALGATVYHWFTDITKSQQCSYIRCLFKDAARSICH
jgi:hypothetical protein